MRKVIMVIEGPAGSGKTYLAREWAQSKGVPLISHSLTESRDYPSSSCFNDTMKLTEAVIAPGHLAVIDRLAISQWVYGSLRMEARMPSHPFWTVKSHQSLAQVIGACHALRLESTEPTEISVHLYFGVYLPSVEVIRERRSKSGKEYPWDPEDERELYLDFASRAGLRVFSTYEEGWKWLNTTSTF